ncbi:hypothetical protein AB0J86_08900 [Micromonospora sp. NPDC049559]|uniref:hypothetical protein n=1 Tax=Micromonospora sp. NPDC049559 TaxID=3155923 RepID=UPI003421EA23
MNPQVTEALRDTFQEFTDATPPAGLARAALRRARRQRLARLTTGAVAACAALAAVVGTVAVGLPGDGGTAGRTAAGGPGPSVVTAYSGVRDPKIADPSPAYNYSLLLNYRTGRYDRVPYRFAMPSPDGRRVLVGIGDNSTAHPSRAGIMDRASGQVRWIEAPPGITGFPGYSQDGHWSPDGRRILFTHRPRPGQGTGGFVLVDPDTLRTSFVALPDLETHNAQGHGLTWTPTSDGVALTLSVLNQQENAYITTGIRFYDLSGKEQATVPVQTPLARSGAFSPDGGRMALVDEESPGPETVINVADPATGALDRPVRLDRPARLVGWADDRHLLVHVFGDSAPPGAARHDQFLVVDLDARVTRTLRPVDAGPQEIFLGPAAGLPADAAAKLTF